MRRYGLPPQLFFIGDRVAGANGVEHDAGKVMQVGWLEYEGVWNYRVLWDCAGEWTVNPGEMFWYRDDNLKEMN
jgi:hypothetical protein